LKERRSAAARRRARVSITLGQRVFRNGESYRLHRKWARKKICRAPQSDGLAAPLQPL